MAVAPRAVGWAPAMAPPSVPGRQVGVPTAPYWEAPASELPPPQHQPHHSHGGFLQNTYRTATRIAGAAKTAWQVGSIAWGVGRQLLPYIAALPEGALFL